MARAAHKIEKNAGSATLLYYYVELPYDSLLVLVLEALIPAPPSVAVGNHLVRLVAAHLFRFSRLAIF